MTDAPKIPRTSRSNTHDRETTEPSETLQAPDVAKCPFSGLRDFVEWMSVVDDININGHSNYLPRWFFVMLVLLYFAVS